MPSLLVIIFVVELAIQAVNTIGASTINNLLWTLLNSLPTQQSKEFAEQHKLQQEFLKCRRDLNATSSQDEFAKWAKLRRHHDKLLDQLEKKKTSLDSARTKFDRYATAIRFISTRGLQYFLPFWYSKEPMFWLPHGWFPYYAEWVLSFPRAPIGSVSIASWQLACTGVIVLLSDTIMAILGLILGSRQKQATPMPGREGGSGQEAKTSAAEDKKDL